MQSAAFLLAPLFIARRVRASWRWGAFVAVSLALVAAGLRGTLPDSYVEGTGLTAFKVYSELRHHHGPARLDRGLVAPPHRL